MKRKLFSLLTLLLTVCSGAWGETVTIKSGTVSEEDFTYSSLTNYSYDSKYWDGKGSNQVISINAGSSFTFTNTGGVTITGITVKGVAQSNDSKSSQITISDDAATPNSVTTGAITWKGRKSTEPTSQAITTGISSLKMTAGTEYTVSNSGYNLGIQIEITYISATTVVTPTISPANGFFFDGATQTVTITATGADHIYYTLDGSTPSNTSTEYTESFNISSTTTIKAIAVKDGYLDSEVATATIKKVISTTLGSWDFTNWSSATQTGVNGDTDAWNQYEKSGESGINFAENGRSNKTAISAGSTLQYGSTNIAETEGLTFASDAYGLGLIFNMGSATVSENKYTYEGSQYLWLYNKNAKITIPDVPAGATIEIAEESHNGGSDRGVSLSGGGATQTSGYATATSYQVATWSIPSGGNVTITPSAGLHIYYITVTTTVETVPITPSYEKTTYVTTKALDFSAVDGLKAYVATGATAAGVTMSSVGAVPADTPLMLIGTAGETYDVPVAAAASAPETNLLQAGDGTTEFSGSSYDYILYSDGKFYQIGDGIVAIGKAYLHLDTAPAAGARSLNILFDDESVVTGISATLNDKAEMINDNSFYNLNGQRIAQPSRGLYIVNGRKVIIR